MFKLFTFHLNPFKNAEIKDANFEMRYMYMKPFIWLSIPPIMFADYTSCVSVYSLVGTILLLAYLGKYLVSIPQFI